MNKTKATPKEGWTITDVGHTEEISEPIGSSGARYILAYIKFTGNSELQNVNRTKIVQAVNNYDRMVELLTDIMVDSGGNMKPAMFKRIESLLNDIKK